MLYYIGLEFQYTELADNSKCLPPYGHWTTWVSESWPTATFSSSSVTDPVCKTGNKDDKDPEGFQLQENPCTTDTDQSLSYESLNITTHN